MEPPKEYISSNEGEKLLGVSRQRFFYYVNQGRIEKIPGATPRKSLYNKTDILKLKGEISDGEEVQTDLIVDWIHPADLPKTLALDLIVYEEDIIGDFKLYLSWLKRNPHLTLGAFDESRNTVYAYLNLLPLDESTILSILRGEREETSIKAEEIKTYDDEGEYTLLAESIVAHPDHPEAIGSIMNEVSEFWCNQWPTRRVKRIYAQTVSDNGLFLVQRLYFAPLLDYPDNAYILDMGRKNFSKIVQKYQECIEKKRRKLENA
jgi:hypothetical protein